MEGEEEAMTGLLQLRLMPRSYLPATPVQSRPPGIIGQPKVFADCTTLQPDQSLKKRVLDCCTLCNISKKFIYKLYQYSSFSGEHHICHYPKPVPSSTIVNCSCTFLCSQARRMLHHHWLVVDSLQPWLIIGPRSSYRPSRRQLIVSSPQTFLSCIKISPNFFELNKNLHKLFWVE